MVRVRHRVRVRLGIGLGLWFHSGQSQYVPLFRSVNIIRNETQSFRSAVPEIITTPKSYSLLMPMQARTH